MDNTYIWQALFFFSAGLAIHWAIEKKSVMHQFLSKRGWLIYGSVCLLLGALLFFSTPRAEVTRLEEAKKSITELCDFSNKKHETFSVKCDLDYDREVISIEVYAADREDKIYELMTEVAKSFCLLANMDPEIHSGSIVWNGGQWTCEEFKALVK